MGRHNITTNDLTNDQRQLIANVLYWYKYDQDEDYVYSGPAGTGKTSVIPLIIEELGLEPDEVLFVAYTGKAASVLMQKGFDASTIHSAFYDVIEKPLVIDGKVIKKNGRVVKTIGFEKKPYISSKIKLIVADEWSMINNEHAETMYSFGVPLLLSGDKFQLEPVFGVSPFASKIKFELNEITRQGKDSGIIQLATLIRKGKDLPTYMNFKNDAWVMPKYFLKDKHLLNADMVLTAKNKTRNIFNDRIRELHGSKGKLPNVGDKLINRKNCWTMSLEGIPLVNGIIGKVINPIQMSECNLKQGLYRIDFQPDYVQDFYEFYDALLCDYDYLKQPCGSKTVDAYNTGAKMEFAEAITVHLSQGSQYDNVLYYDEIVGNKSTMNKLRYTAVTRAVKKVHMFV